MLFVVLVVTDTGVPIGLADRLTRVAGLPRGVDPLTPEGRMAVVSTAPTMMRCQRVDDLLLSCSARALYPFSTPCIIAA
jgi:hypothetical protein